MDGTAPSQQSIGGGFIDLAPLEALGTAPSASICFAGVEDLLVLLLYQNAFLFGQGGETRATQGKVSNAE